MHRLLLAGLLLCATAPALRAQEHKLEAVAWLTGCWASETGEAGSGEQWTAPAGGTMLGMGRTVRNGQTVDHEFLQIRVNAEGRLVYVALPARQKEATFVASELREGAVIFENPQHDFPQRISYRLQPGGRLHARIEGLRGGTLRGVDFPLRRVACDR
jgi:hypothetical protein